MRRSSKPLPKDSNKRAYEIFRLSVEEPEEKEPLKEKSEIAGELDRIKHPDSDSPKMPGLVDKKPDLVMQDPMDTRVKINNSGGLIFKGRSQVFRKKGDDDVGVNREESLKKGPGGPTRPR